MRKVSLYFAMLGLALMLTSAVHAEDGEWTAVVTVKDGAMTAKVGDKEFVLKGDEAAKIKEGGTYKIKGTVSDDGKTMTAKEVKKAD